MLKADKLFKLYLKFYNPNCGDNTIVKCIEFIQKRIGSCPYCLLVLITGISKKRLSRRLRILEERGFIIRKTVKPMPFFVSKDDVKC